MLAKEKTWKRIFNTNGELSQNRTEKQTVPFKTSINWLFNKIWCYLFSAYFDWKTGVFQQTVVRVYYTLKKSISLNFQFFFLQLKNERSGSKTVCSFPIILIWKELWKQDVNKNRNFNKSEAESKMENPTHFFRGINLVLQLIKSKTVMTWSSWKKECI